MDTDLDIEKMRRGYEEEPDEFEQRHSEWEGRMRQPRYQQSLIKEAIAECWEVYPEAVAVMEWYQSELESKQARIQQLESELRAAKAIQERPLVEGVL